MYIHIYGISRYNMSPTNGKEQSQQSLLAHLDTPPVATCFPLVGRLQARGKEVSRRLGRDPMAAQCIRKGEE